MKSHSIRVWLSFLIALSILPLLALSFVSILRASAEEQQRTLDRVKQTTRAINAAIDRHFSGRIALLQGLASSTALEQNDFTQFRRRAINALTNLPGAEIVLFDESGRILLDTSVPENRPLPFRNNLQSVKQVFQSARPVISDLFRHSLTDRFAVSVDVPVFVDGKVRYGLGVIIHSTEFNEIAREQRIPGDWFFGVLNRTGILAARLPFPERYVGTLAAPLLRNAVNTASEGNVETPTLEGVTVISTWTRSNTTGWAVALAVPKATLFEPLYESLILLLGGGLAVAVLAAILAYYLSSAVSSRLVILEARAKSLGISTPMPALPAGIREIDNVDRELTIAAETIQDQQLHQSLLMAELDHRVKNILATVQAIAMKTLGRTQQANDLAGRLKALAEAHSLLTRTQGRGASLAEIIESTLRVHIAARQISFEGPPLLLNAKATQAIALALHELGTNSVKYGALSKTSGEVRIRWSTTGDNPRFNLTWSEFGGPLVAPRSRKGFGSTLIEKNLPTAISGSVEMKFPSDGLKFQVQAPLSEVIGEGAAPPTSIFSSVDKGFARLRSGSKVLLVEDEELLAGEVRALLTDQGCIVTIANRVEDAIGLVDQPFDAAVLDVNLNGRPSFSVADALIERGVPFIFLTGYEDPRVWPEHLRSITRIGKPVDSRELSAALFTAVQKTS